MLGPVSPTSHHTVQTGVVAFLPSWGALLQRPTFPLCVPSTSWCLDLSRRLVNVHQMNAWVDSAFWQDASLELPALHGFEALCPS